MGDNDDKGSSDVRRFRLKFPRQEVDLRPGEHILGRSPACAITIEDPLVSRQHALFRVTGAEVTYEDLASRNGSRINGMLVRRPTVLEHNDIVSIGRHDLRFLALPFETRSKTSVTGFLRNCSSCKLPYAEEAGACPHCGSEPTIEEPPPTERSSPHAWTLGMFIEMLERSIVLGRADDAHRLTIRAASHLDELVAAGVHVSREQVETLVNAARRALDREDATKIVSWASALYERFGWSNAVRPTTTLR